MEAANIPTKYPTIFGAGAVSPFIRTVPVPSQIQAQGGAASFTTGFPPLCFTAVGLGGVPPWGADFNGLFNSITAWIQFTNNAGCMPQFDPTFSAAIGGYPQGAVINDAASSVIWLSLVDNNTASPDAHTGTWAQFAMVLVAPQTYFVNGTTGSDNNNGLSATVGTAPVGPFKTIQRGIIASQQFNLNGFTVTIEVANGTYNGPVALPPTNGSGGVAIIGNQTTPSLCVVNGGAGANNITGSVGGGLPGSAFQGEGQGYSISGFLVTGVFNSSNGDPGAGILCNKGTIGVNVIQMGACGFGQFYSGGAASISINGPILVSGSAMTHMTAIAGSSIIPNVSTPPPITFLNAVTYSNAFIAVSTVGVVGTPEPGVLLFGTITGAANVTGSRYSAALNGTIATGTSGNQTYLPGTTAGTTFAGGQYF